jgi:hypothetical protein
MDTSELEWAQSVAKLTRIALYPLFIGLTINDEVSTYLQIELELQSFSQIYTKLTGKSIVDITELMEKLKARGTLSGPEILNSSFYQSLVGIADMHEFRTKICLPWLWKFQRLLGQPQVSIVTISCWLCKFWQTLFPASLIQEILLETRRKNRRRLQF